MMEQLSAWWRARTGRERLLLQGAGLFVFAILLPIWAFLAAQNFRDAGAAALADARAIEAQVVRLAEASESQDAGAGSADPSVRGKAMAAAQAARLTIAHLETSGPEQVRVRFEASDSLAIYRWIDAVGRRGAYVSRSSITRVADSDLVTAEFEVAAGP